MTGSVVGQMWAAGRQQGRNMQFGAWPCEVCMVGCAEGKEVQGGGGGGGRQRDGRIGGGRQQVRSGQGHDRAHKGTAQPAGGDGSDQA